MKKIVVAESSPTIKSVADTLLRQNGYDVVCTSDGLQAWEVVSSGKPDLVLTGLNLSGMNGLELCRQMAGDGLSGGIPVVVMIGSKDNISDDELRSSGIKAKLKKPFSPRDLLTIVNKLIGKGEKSNQPETISKETAATTKQQADASSTARHREDKKGDIYSLDWTDLNDGGADKEAELKEDGPPGVPADDQEIVINEDQFGMASLIIGQEDDQRPETKASGDEDYDWFIGEMKKDNRDEPEKKPPEKDIPEDKELSAESGGPSDIDDDELQFEDFESSGSKLLVPDTAPAEKKVSQSQPSKVGIATARQKLSEEELSRIADKVTQNLAAAITASIDRQKLLDAIKSVLNQ